MSPLRRPVILDNDVLSRLFSGGALRRALEIWPKGSFRITDRVMEEAGQWPARGQELTGILKDMESDGVIEIIGIDEACEEEMSIYIQIRLRDMLGSGESTSIAIACHRGFDFATDDGAARKICQELCPSVNILGTGLLLNMAVSEGLMTQSETDFIQARIRRSRS